VGAVLFPTDSYDGDELVAFHKFYFEFYIPYGFDNSQQEYWRDHQPFYIV
jgi:hypothetical protein